MTTLATYEYGDSAGTPLLCLHGVTGHGRRFEALGERLADRRVVGISYRGHGESTRLPPWDVEQLVADLVDTAAALGVDRADWAGHSFGGRLIVELAMRHPELVERAVLLDPALHVDPEVALERAELLRQDVSYGSPEEAIDERLGDGSLFTTPRAILEREAEAHLVRGPDGRLRWNYTNPAVTVAWSAMASDPPPWPLCPTLVVTGERSWIPIRVPRLATIRHIVVPGGHSVLWDDFDATADAIESFLST